jgi:pilus assembly protein CpaE
VIAVMGVRPGVGTTTVAANLAIALHATSSKRVIVVDAHLPFGDLDLLLNIPAGRSWADLVPYLDELDSDVLNTVLATHASGVQVLLAPGPQEDTDGIPENALATIVTRLRSMADYVVLDASPPDWEGSAPLLEVADIIALVLTPDLPSLSLTPLALDLARAKRTPPPEVYLVLNRAGSGLAASAIETQLQQKFAVQLPEEEEAATVAANRGIPLIMSRPNSGLSREMRNFAKIFAPALREAKPGGTRFLGR